jgi:hypothetical protein
MWLRGLATNIICSYGAQQLNELNGRRTDESLSLL